MATTQKKKRLSTWKILLGIAILFLVVLFFTLRSGNNKATEVITEKVERRTLLSTVSESGTIEPVMEVKIQPDVSGEIVELPFKEGDKVKKGDHLLTIKPDNYQSVLSQTQASLNATMANVRQTEAAVEQARSSFLQDSTNFRRTDDLFKQKVVSRAEWEAARLKLDISRGQYSSARHNLEAARFQVNSSRFSVDQARQNLDKTSIHATMDGTITLLNRELGERVVGSIQMEGTEILRIADLSRMQVTVDINENDIVNLRIGDSAHIEVDAYENKIFRGVVKEIAYSATSSAVSLATDQVTQFKVKVEIDPKSYLSYPEIINDLPPNQSPFRPGMSAQIEIFTDRVDNALSVPIQAVTVRRSETDPDAEPKELVFVLDGNQVKEVEVTTGLSDDKYIQILTGLTGTETIITGPYLAISKTLEDGMTVSIMDESKKEKASGNKPNSPNPSKKEE